jgi:ABC-type spermidine/putrescine transport system permease subunit II
MKKQPGNIEQIYSSVVSFFLALPICAAIWISMKIVWPILRFCAKFAWKQIGKALSKSKVVKPPKATLPTPEIFKNAPNLARAKSVRF